MIIRLAVGGGAALGAFGRVTTHGIGGEALGGIAPDLTGLYHNTIAGEGCGYLLALGAGHDTAGQRKH